VVQHFIQISIQCKLASTMGKSIRCKFKKRLRTAKRQRVDAMIVTPRVEENYDSLKRIIEGRAVRLSTPKNAFKYPDAEGAVFPQHEVMKPIDFRAQHLPMAGYVFRGNRRKYDKEETEYMSNLAKTHPKMEVLGGGGAILAKTGQKVSKKEAELVATRALRPEVAAIAESSPASASNAVAAAIAEKSDQSTNASIGDMKMDCDDRGDDAKKVDADNSRRPLSKDTTKTQRQRPRANAVKKKAKKGKQA